MTLHTACFSNPTLKHGIAIRATLFSILLNCIVCMLIKNDLL